MLQALGVIDQTHKFLCRSGVYMFGNRDAGKPVMLPVGHNVKIMGAAFFVAYSVSEPCKT